jgi:hypothetical protein
MRRVPRQLLLNDEGNSALHYVDVDAPARGWTYDGPGRDLQLIGGGRVLRSSPTGYVELDLRQQGKVARQVALSAPGGIESARRLADGQTVVLGNGAEGIFVWQVSAEGAPVRQLVGAGLEKGRLLRLTDEGTFLFCSETNGERIVHEASFGAGLQTLFRIPDDVPADSMVKAVRTAPERIAVSTGYTASLLYIDTARQTLLQTIGGKGQTSPLTVRRPLSPHFFSGFQHFENGDCLIANWQGHGRDHGQQGYQLLMYGSDGQLFWTFDQTEYPFISSLNNVIALDGLDLERLHEERGGVLVPVS